jgi:hypothetical protein
MPPEDLDHIWVCCQCQKSFLYKDDKEEHVRITGHSDLKMYELAELLDRYEGANIQNSRYKQDDEFS